MTGHDVRWLRWVIVGVEAACRADGIPEGPFELVVSGVERPGRDVLLLLERRLDLRLRVLGQALARGHRCTATSRLVAVSWESGLPAIRIVRAIAPPLDAIRTDAPEPGPVCSGSELPGLAGSSSV